MEITSLSSITTITRIIISENGNWRLESCFLRLFIRIRILEGLGKQNEEEIFYFLPVVQTKFLIMALFFSFVFLFPLFCNFLVNSLHYCFCRLSQVKSSQVQRGLKLGTSYMGFGSVRDVFVDRKIRLDQYRLDIVRQYMYMYNNV